jgi:hypothetical protein
MTFAPTNSQAAYLPPEQDFPEDNGVFREILSNRFRLTATILNVKENAQYELSETLNAQQWFSTTPPNVTKITRYAYRITFDLVAMNGGPIGAGATSLELNQEQSPLVLTNITFPVHMFGAATVAGPKYLPLPYASASGDNIEIWFDNTLPTAQTININNAYGSNLITCYICFEYLKQ